MSAPVYVIFHCDQWQSYESMRLIGVATEAKLTEVLLAIQEKLNYSEEDMNTYIYIKETFPDDVDSMNI